MKIHEIKPGLSVKHPHFGNGKIINEVLIGGKPSGACMVQFNTRIEPLEIACYYLKKED